MVYKILLVGGIKGYTKYHEHIIEILRKLNSDVSGVNTDFITLQPYPNIHDKADLYIDSYFSDYLIVSDKIMEKLNYVDKPYRIAIPFEDPEIRDFDKSLDGSFDFVITEHAWFCDPVEILKYHNLLKVNGYLIKYTTSDFPNSDISYIDKCYYGNHYISEQHRVTDDISLKSVENIFLRIYPNIFQKITDIYYIIEEHSIKYKEHCVNYLFNVK